MPELVADAAVDAVRIGWGMLDGAPGPCVFEAPAQLRVIRDLLSRSAWQSFAQFILPGVVDRHGRVAEYSGFRFQGDLDPDDDPFPGVEVFDPIDTIYVSESAFDRLMARYASAIIDGVTSHGGPERLEAWWSQLVAWAATLQARAAATSSQSD